VSNHGKFTLYINTQCATIATTGCKGASGHITGRIGLGVTMDKASKKCPYAGIEEDFGLPFENGSFVEKTGVYAVSFSVTGRFTSATHVVGTVVATNSCGGTDTFSLKASNTVAP
jgi:hypothetical protein